MTEQQPSAVAPSATRIIEILQGSIDEGVITFPDWALEKILQKRDATIRREAWNSAVHAVKEGDFTYSDGDGLRDIDPRAVDAIVAALEAAREGEGAK